MSVGGAREALLIFAAAAVGKWLGLEARYGDRSRL